MKLRLSDDQQTLAFAPLTLTRPISELRIGLQTIRERWVEMLGAETVVYDSLDYLSVAYPTGDADLTVNVRVLPDEQLINRIAQLQDNEKLWVGDTWVAHTGIGEKKIEFQAELLLLNHRWDLFQLNESILKSDFKRLTAGRASQKLSASNTLIGDSSALFIEDGAQVEASVLNTKAGPIYIGKEAEVMEGSLIRGPFALLDHATLKMGAKMYGGTTIGPYCKVGGEVSNSIFYAYSNKGHDGFVGNSLIGEWCNLGADTNTSNLKNNYGQVKTYDFQSESLIQTYVTFMGLSMGDHSKSSINTMFNTASTTGVFTNVFQAGFPDKYLPSFSWGSKDVRFELDKAFEAADAMMSRRGKQLSAAEKEILSHLFHKVAPK